MLNIHVIIGKSLSGKTYVSNKLSLPRLVTSTTRKKRDGEVSGADYHFISDKQYQEAKKNGVVLAERSYKLADDSVVHYFVDLGVLNSLKDEVRDLVVILDYQGYRELMTDLSFYTDFSLHGHYLDIDLKERMRRSFNEDRSSEDVKEVLRRLYYDEFIDFEELDCLSPLELSILGIRKYSSSDELVDFFNSL